MKNVMPEGLRNAKRTKLVVGTVAALTVLAGVTGCAGLGRAAHHHQGLREAERCGPRASARSEVWTRRPTP